MRPIEDFRGLIAGERFTREIYRECGIISTFYAVNIGLEAERRKKLEKALEEAEAEFEAKKNDPQLGKRRSSSAIRPSPNSILLGSGAARTSRT